MPVSRIVRPIFVVAPPRSGAALLFELFSNLPALSPLRHAAVIDSVAPVAAASRGWDSHRLTAADATPEIAAAIEEAYYNKLHHGDQRLLEHTGQNALRIPFLAELFPDAQFLVVHRDPRFAIAGMLETWRSGVSVTEPQLPGWSGPPWSMVLVPGWRELAGKPLPELVARQWSSAVSLLLDDLEQLPRARWHALSWERLLAEPRPELARLCTFLGVDMPMVGTLPREEPASIPDELEPFLPLVVAADERARAVYARPQEDAAVPAPPAVDGVEAFRSVSTPTFAEILDDLGLSLLVTTYQSGRVMLVRAQGRGALNTHMRMFPSPMGVAVGQNVLAIGAKQEVVEFRNQPAVAAALDPPNVNDAVWIPGNIHVSGDIRIHEMAWLQGELWAVNTLFSTLCTISHGYSFVPRWRPPFITALAPEDRCHLNGMAVEHDRVRYVTALGETDTAGGWRTNKPAGGVIVDVGSGETRVRGLSMPHSPRLHAGRLWLLESGKGTLATADPASGTVETIAEMPGFTRGLAFADRYAFVGLSQVRESNVFGGIPLVERVKDRQCGIWVIDLTSMRFAAFLRFEGIVQEIFDVQVLPGMRFPELLELHDPRVATSYAVPEEAAYGVPAG
jgi:uncharacterized protein (TIGR03032 family)